MRVLAVNAGSSSLKFELLARRSSAWETVATGQVDRIAGDARLRLEVAAELRCSEPVEAPDVATAAELALTRLAREVDLASVDAVGHRVVHGGPTFTGPALIDPGVVEAIEAVGASVRYLPPYSPDLNPFELAFSKFKKLLRDGAARTTETLWELCGRVLDLFPEHECRNHLRHCGYRYSRSGPH